VNSFVTSQPSIPAQIKEESTRTVIDIHPTPELRAALASLEGVAIIRVDVQYRRDTEGQSIIRCSYRQAAGSEACTRDYLRPARERARAGAQPGFGCSHGPGVRG
jgi:hypothetical protein